MVKKPKKNVKDFRQALLSNTDFIRHGNEPEETLLQDNGIDSELLDKFELLAEFEQTTSNELIQKALNHYLKLKGLQLEQALKAKNQKNNNL